MPDCREENQRGRLTLSFYEEEKIGSFLLLFHKKGIYRLTDFRFEKETTEEKRMRSGKVCVGNYTADR